MAIKKYSISNDPELYEAWPDVVLTNSGKLICVFSECLHHINRDYTRIMLTESLDRGRTWSKKHPLTEGTAGLDYYYNCPRIRQLKSGKIVITIDRLPQVKDRNGRFIELENEAEIYLFTSDDDGHSWSDIIPTPVKGIVPDRITELDNGRLIISAQMRSKANKLAQYMHYSDDGGKSWSQRITIAEDDRYNLCEVSILPLGNGKLAAFMRENSGFNIECQKSLSYDNGESWTPVIDFPVPYCHRPTAGFLNNGQILITCRMRHGGKSGWGIAAQNTIAALTDTDSVLSLQRNGAWTRVLPLDYDRSPVADTGYTGHVQFSDGEIYVVNYIVDDAIDKGQIRGYSLNLNDFILEG